MAAAGKTNWFAIWVSVAVLVVLALVIGLVVWMNSSASDPGTPPSGSGVNQETGAVVTSYYWHFVDVVWIALFAMIYLLQ